MKRVFYFILFYLASVSPVPAQTSALDEADLAYLRLIEQATFQGFESLLDPATGLPVDGASVVQGRVQRPERNPLLAKASPSHMAMQAFYLILARERGYLKEQEAYEKAFQLLDTLENLEKQNGFLFNWYGLSGGRDRELRVILNRFVPFADNGLLDTSLYALSTVYQGTPLEKKIENFLKSRDYGFFYNRHPSGGTTGYLNAGYDAEAKQYSEQDLSILNQAARAAVFLAVLKGDVPKAGWWNQERIVKRYRTFSGEMIPVVSSWGGGLSEFLFADEVLAGDRIAPNAFGLNASHVIRIQRDRGGRLSESGIWGFSSGQVPDQDRYEVSGIPEIAYKRFDSGFVVPYASFLAMRYEPRAAVENLKAIVRLNPASLGRNYGFCDSLDPRTGLVNRNLLALDKGMELVALANFLSAREGGRQIGDYLWEAFKRRGWERQGLRLLKAEELHPSFLSLRANGSGDERTLSAAVRMNLMDRTRDIGTFYDPGQARASYVLEEDRRGAKGLRVRYDVRRRAAYSGLYMKFRDLDASPYQALEFLMRGSEAKGYPERVKVELKHKGKHVQFEHVPLYGSWHQVKVLLPVARKQFDEIVFVFENAQAGKHPDGEIQIRSLAMR